jgi:hypothetical protein
MKSSDKFKLSDEAILKLEDIRKKKDLKVSLL